MSKEPHTAVSARLRHGAALAAMLSLVIGLFLVVPRLAHAQAGPTLTVQTTHITDPNGSAVLDIVLDPAGGSITALEFVVLVDPANLTITGYELVAPAGGAFNAINSAQVRNGVFYTVDPFDPNDAGGFASPTVIARISVQGTNLTAAAPVNLQIIEAFDIDENQANLVGVGGGITIAAGATLPPTAIPTPRPSPTVTPTPTPETPTTTPPPDFSEVFGPSPQGEPLGALRGYIWVDIDQDGIQEPGAGVDGVTVTATGPDGTQTTTSESDGTWEIINLAEGEYVVTFADPLGRSWTLPEVGDDTNDSDADQHGNAGAHQVVRFLYTGSIDGGLFASTAAAPTVEVVATAAFPATPQVHAGTPVQLGYPGPINVVPQTSAGGTGGFGLNPQAAPGALSATSDASSSANNGGITTGTGTATGGGAPLANTGAQTNALVTASISLFALGGALMVHARRKQDILR